MRFFYEIAGFYRQLSVARGRSNRRKKSRGGQLETTREVGVKKKNGNIKLKGEKKKTNDADTKIIFNTRRVPNKFDCVLIVIRFCHIFSSK